MKFAKFSRAIFYRTPPVGDSGITIGAVSILRYGFVLNQITPGGKVNFHKFS